MAAHDPRVTNSRPLKWLAGWALSSPFHPLLFAAYPSLSLLAANISEMQLKDAVRPIGISLAFACLLLLICRPIYKDWGRAAGASSLCLILFFSYGHVYSVLKRVSVLEMVVGRHRHLLPVWFLLGALGLWILGRRAWQGRQLTTALNLISAAAVIVPIYTLAAFALAPRPQESPFAISTARFVAPTGAAPGTLPDIYYIVTDSYARQDVLAARFGYDNSEFIEFLESRGFYVASESKTNYAYTYQSLGSALNMAYLEQEKLPPENVSETLVTWLRQSVVRAQLEELGYQVVAFASGYRGTEFHDADVFLRPDIPTLEMAGARATLNSLEELLIHMSLGRAVEDIEILRNTALGEYVASNEMDEFIAQREIALSAFEGLAEVPDLPSPKFVFVHIIPPHFPYVFGPEGEEVEAQGPFTLVEDEPYLNTPAAQLYVGQLHYVTARLRGDIEAILAKSKRPVIIILQSDHGPRIGLDANHPDRKGLEARAAILNAYYLPEGCRRQLYPSISPVNSFRLVSACVFGGTYPLLEDLSYVGRQDLVLLDEVLAQLED